MARAAGRGRQINGRGPPQLHRGGPVVQLMAQQLPPDPAALTSITAFQNLPAEVLAWLISAGELRQYADDEAIVRAGDPANQMLAVVRGGMQYFRGDNGQRSPCFGWQRAASAACCLIPGCKSFGAKELLWAKPCSTCCPAPSFRPWSKSAPSWCSDWWAL
ncbi:MAG: cyclic nucleotide-binding domain-containing protein [Hymenobacter sp.]